MHASGAIPFLLSAPVGWPGGHKQARVLGCVEWSYIARHSLRASEGKHYLPSSSRQLSVMHTLLLLGTRVLTGVVLTYCKREEVCRDASYIPEQDEKL